MSMNLLANEDKMPIDYRPCFTGELIQWNKEKKFGFIKPATPIKGQDKVTAFFSDKIGNQPIELMPGAKCIFTLGMDPRRYLRGKNDLSALVWFLEEDIGNFSQYEQSRESYLLDLQNLQNILKALWYVNLWAEKAKRFPICPLETDIQLLQAVENAEANISSSSLLTQWLHFKSESPYFATTPQERSIVIQNGWNAAVIRKGDLLRSLSLGAFMDLRHKNLMTEENETKLLPYMLKLNSIALDIESNGEDIYQLGYATESNSGLFTGSKTNFLQEIEQTELAAHSKSHWIVGHNIVAWDLPILRKREQTCFRQHTVWDTLLLSWILAPWKRTHALVNRGLAHRADSDALAALDLFYQQLDDHFPTEALRFWTQRTESIDPIDVLYEDSSILDKMINRDYPELPAYLEKHDETLECIIPHWRLIDCAWCKEVTYTWPEHYIDEDAFQIKLDALEHLSRREKNIWIKTLTIVLRDAENNNVRVLLRMIPAWLKDKTIQTLRKGKCLEINHRRTPNAINISTYYSYSRHDDATLIKTLSAKSKECLFWQEGQFDLLPEHQDLRNDDVTQKLGIETPSAYALFPLEDQARQFISHNDLTTRRAWLTYDPANMRDANASCWQLQTRILLQNPQNEVDEPDKDPSGQDQQVAGFPRWTAPYGNNILISRDFIPPTSANRRQYWEDALSRFLSLGNDESFTGIYVLLVSHRHEKDAIASVLSDYGATVSFDGAPLRHLERLNRENCRFSVDLLERADQWLLASEQLTCEIQLVIESLPLHHWWLCGSSATGNIRPEITDNTVDDEPEEDDVEDPDSDDDLDTQRTKFYKPAEKYGHLTRSLPVELSHSTIEICVERFLKPWFSKILGGYAPIRPPLILDCRFDRFHFSKPALFPRHNFKLQDPSSQQKERLRHLLHDRMGDIDRQSAPTDYETYRKFLKEHWGDNHDDFRPDTQRPAIEAIIPNDSDVLVRLPTGEGKSVLFQIPALVRGLKTKRLTLVITPLKALMADQVNKLWSMGFHQSVDFLSGDKESWENSDAYQGIIDNRIKLLYVAPERFRVPRFREALSRRLENDRTFEYVVVDEAHCISQWGFQFRPDYLYAIRELRRICRATEPVSRFLLFSATVTAATQKAIEEEVGGAADGNFKIRPEKRLYPIQGFIDLTSIDVGTELYGKDNTLAISNRLGFIESKIRQADLSHSAIVIFVTRKRHAEILCQLLKESVETGTLRKDTSIQYFHAGLSAAERSEIYEGYRNRTINVLVCTKAFGMGMDISHIHRCIHLAPPSYLEDYLQEVGRTGRGQKEREDANLVSVDCDLLFHKSDFEKNLEKTTSSQVRFIDLATLWNGLTERTKEEPASRRQLCVIPQNQYLNLDKNKLRLSLFWLERWGRIDILGSLANILNLRLHKDRMNLIAVGKENVNLVAAAIMQLYQSTTQNKGSVQFSEVISKTLDFIGHFIGAIRTKSTPVSTKEERDIETPEKCDWDVWDINLERIWQVAGVPRIDDVFTALLELQKRQAVLITQHIEFDPRQFSECRSPIWNWLDLVLNKILVTTPETGRPINQAEMLSWLNDVEIEPSGFPWNEQNLGSAKQKVIQAGIRLCASASIRFSEQYGDRQLSYIYTLGKNRIRYTKERIQNVIGIAKRIADLVHAKSTLTFTELLSCCGKRVDQRHLKTALRLLANLGICTNKQDVLSRSYILGLRTTEPLNRDNFTNSERKVQKELERCNLMARYRSHAMEIYARISSKEQRKKYIDKYIDVETPEKLMGFIADTVDEVGSDNPELQEILIGARQEAIKEALLSLHPEKRPICELPYRKIIMVNAGPGAGKTKLLLMRCAHLIHHQEIRPDEILVLAFNRAVVFELKEKIISLFKQLRYGSYVKRLNIHTFHAFAARAMQSNTRGNDDWLQELLHSFAERLRTDELFRMRISGGYRAILVDEFQDMNDDLYSVILSLQECSGAGLMVIGDDDQDILLWNREKRQKERLHGSDYFETYKRDLADVEVRNLETNFRSTQTIVDQSQNFLEKVISGIPNVNRLKSHIKLRSNVECKCDSEIDQQIGFEDFIKMIPSRLEASNKVAILCRTNAEVFQTHQVIIESGIVDRRKILIQNDIQQRLADVRESAEWLDLCARRISEDGNKSLSDQLYEQLLADFIKLNLPSNNDPLVGRLWRLTLAQYNNPTLQQHIEFIEDMSIADVDRIAARHEEFSEGRLILSTVNKVKGLEFDTVFIKSSDVNFPLSSSNGSIHDYAAEEARLFYVAMTRAKHSLYFEWGEREKAWSHDFEWTERERAQSKLRKYNGSRFIFLEGEKNEVHLSWPGYRSQFERGLQDYIKQNVAVGDIVSITDGKIIHKNKQIGILAKDVKKKTWEKGEVSAVIRSPVNDKLKQDWPSIYDKIHPVLIQKGWLYTALVRSA